MIKRFKHKIALLSSGNQLKPYYVPYPDINECTSMPGACANGHCLNTMGSYRCVCDKGYKTSSDGMRCIGESYLILICH